MQTHFANQKALRSQQDYRTKLALGEMNTRRPKMLLTNGYRGKSVSASSSGRGTGQRSRSGGPSEQAIFSNPVALQFMRRQQVCHAPERITTPIKGSATASLEILMSKLSTILQVRKDARPLRPARTKALLEIMYRQNKTLEEAQTIFYGMLQKRKR